MLLAGVVIALVLTEKGMGDGCSPAPSASRGAVALFLTYTRGSWLALAVGLVVFIVLTDIRYLAAAGRGRRRGGRGGTRSAHPSLGLDRQ